MTRKRRIWIVIADGARARILALPAEGRELSEVESLASEEAHRLSHDQGSDRPGRSQESAASAHHAVEPRSDPQRNQKRAFIRRVAERLATAHRQDLFDSLILAAAPSALGDLRQALDKATRATVIHELDKDLTKVPKHELPGHLPDLSPGAIA